MFIESLEMGHATAIPLQFEFLELRHGDTQGLPNVAQPSVEGFRLSSCNLFQEITTVRITRLSDRSIRLTDQLGNDM
jgi:hypothetical protein